MGKYFRLVWSFAWLTYSLHGTVVAFSGAGSSILMKVAWVVMDLLWIESAYRRSRELDEVKK